jgi:hypothetical protein
LTGLSSGTLYYYRAFATNSVGTSYGSEGYSFTTNGGTAATPTFSPTAGAISSGTTIAITSLTGGVTICYTLNGDTPTAGTAGTCDSDSGNEHSISNGGSTSAITSALTVKAIATESGYTNSGVGSAGYTIFTPPTLAPAVVMF